MLDISRIVNNCRFNQNSNSHLRKSRLKLAFYDFGKKTVISIGEKAITSMNQHGENGFEIDIKHLCNDDNERSEYFYNYIGKCCQLSSCIVLWNCLNKYKIHRLNYHNKQRNSKNFVANADYGIELYPLIFNNNNSQIKYDCQYHRLELDSEISNQQEPYITYFTFPGLCKRYQVDGTSHKRLIANACVFCE